MLVAYCVALYRRKSLSLMLLYPIVIGPPLVGALSSFLIQIKEGFVFKSHGGLFLKFNQ